MSRRLLTAALAGLLSCASKTAPADGPGAVDPGAAETPAATATHGSPSWGEMTFAQKKAHMSDAVVPKLGEVFRGYDADRFAGFDCATCHGPGADDGSFAMPNASLPKLPPPEEFAAFAESKPEIMAFMLDVEHATAALIDRQPYDPKTNEGFGCYDCHTF